jgi:nuclear cap-binding protein subunit 1
MRVWSVVSNIKPCPDDYDHYDHRREVQESPDQKLKATIIKFGEVVRSPNSRARSFHTPRLYQDAEQEIPQLANKLQSQEPSSIPAIAEGFRLAYIHLLW